MNDHMCRNMLCYSQISTSFTEKHRLSKVTELQARDDLSVYPICKRLKVQSIIIRFMWATREINTCSYIHTIRQSLAKYTVNLAGMLMKTW